MDNELRDRLEALLGGAGVEALGASSDALTTIGLCEDLLVAEGVHGIIDEKFFGEPGGPAVIFRCSANNNPGDIARAIRRADWNRPVGMPFRFVASLQKSRFLNLIS